MQGYCLKCRTKREIAKPVVATSKKGNPYTEGCCSVCGTKIVALRGPNA